MPLQQTWVSSGLCKGKKAFPCSLPGFSLGWLRLPAPLLARFLQDLAGAQASLEGSTVSLVLGCRQGCVSRSCLPAGSCRSADQWDWGRGNSCIWESGGSWTTWIVQERSPVAWIIPGRRRTMQGVGGILGSGEGTGEESSFPYPCHAWQLLPADPWQPALALTGVRADCHRFSSAKGRGEMSILLLPWLEGSSCIASPFLATFLWH